MEHSPELARELERRADEMCKCASSLLKDGGRGCRIEAMRLINGANKLEVAALVLWPIYARKD